MAATDAVTGEPTRKGLPRRVIAIAAGGLAVAALLIVVLPGVISPGHTLSGRLTILQTTAGVLDPLDGPYTVSSDGSTCFPASGYSDVETGLPVTIRNAANTVVGSSQLGEAEVNPGGTLACSFAFEVTGLPDSEFYVVQIGSRRGDISYSRQEMEDLDWTIEATLAGL